MGIRMPKFGQCVREVMLNCLPLALSHHALIHQALIHNALIHHACPHTSCPHLSPHTRPPSCTCLSRPVHAVIIDPHSSCPCSLHHSLHHVSSFIVPCIITHCTLYHHSLYHVSSRFGDTMNTASRMESTCVEGGWAVLFSVWGTYYF